MAETAAETVLKRKASAGRGPDGAAARTPAQALGIALARAAQDLFRLPVTVLASAESHGTLAELPERLAERALLALLAGPGEGLGLAALSPEVLATLIEIQTTHRIGPPVVATRRPTRTDAAMTMPFIDRVLEELEAGLARHPALVWAGGFRCGSFVDDPRPLGLLLEDTGYRMLTLSLGFGETAARTGTFFLAVPAEGRGPAPRPVPGGETAARAHEAAAGGEWSRQLERAVLDAEVRIEAVLERVSLPIADLVALTPGALLPLSAGAIRRVRVEGLGHRLVATGRLGQCEGHLAVRLSLVPADAGGDVPGDGAGAAFLPATGETADPPVTGSRPGGGAEPARACADPARAGTAPGGAVG